MRDNFIEAGTLEIYRFVPPVCLKKDPGAMDMDEFIYTLACARYLEEVEEGIVASAIAKVWPKQ